MFQFIRSNIAGLPLELPENQPAFLENLYQRVFACDPNSSQVYWVVPNSRRKRYLQRLLGKKPGMVPRIMNLEQWINELAMQGLTGSFHVMSETQRHLVLAKSWSLAANREAGPALLSELDRLFRDYLGTMTDPAPGTDHQIVDAFNHYKKILGENNFADRNTLVFKLVNLLRENNGPAQWLNRQKPFVFLEGFNLFLPVELQLVSEIARKTDVALWMVGNPDSSPGNNLHLATDFFENQKLQVDSDDYEAGNNIPLADVGNRLFKTTSPIEEIENLEALKIYELPDAFSEIHFLTRWLKLQKKTNKDFNFRNVAVVIPGFPYDQLVREFFPRSGIPFNLAGKGFPLAESRPARILQAALELIKGKWAREDLSGYLHLPFVLNVLERPYFVEKILSLPMHFPADAKSWKECFGRFGTGLQIKSESTGHKFQAFLNSLEKVLQPVTQLEQALSSGDLQSILESMIQILHTVKMEDWIQAKPNLCDGRTMVPWAEIEKDQKALSKILDIFRDVLLHGKELLSDKLKNAGGSVSRAEATLHLLQTVLSDRTYQVMSEDDAGVQVFESREIQGLEFDHIFALGLVEGQVPTPRSRGYIPRIRENSRNLWELARARRNEQEYLFSRLFFAARKELFLCHPQKEGQQELIPSIFLKPFEKQIQVPPRLHLITSKMEKQLLEGAVNRSTTGENWASKLRLEENGTPLNSSLGDLLSGEYGPQKEFSPSTLESYSECPFRFLVGKLFHLEPFEDNEYTLLGKLVHNALCDLYNEKRQKEKIPANKPASAFDPNKDAESFQKNCEKLWEEMRLEYAGLLPLHRLNLLFEKNGVLDLLVSHLQAYEKEYGYLAGEKEFSKVLLGKDASGTEVYLAGKIDRIDASRSDTSKISLTDYKTGKPDKKKVQVQLEDGRLLQLQLYSIAARETMSKELGGPVEISKASYVHLADKKSSSKNEVFDLDVPMGEQTENLARQKALENAGMIRAGKFPLSLHVDGKYPECSDYCSFRFVCRHPQGFKNTIY